MDTKGNTNVVALAEMVQQGLASEEDRGIVLRTIQTAMGSALVSSVQSVMDKQGQLDDLLTRCIDKFTSQVNDLITSDTINHEDLFEMITTLQKNQVACAELLRKVVQSPNKIFSDDLLSNEEKKLLKLLKSFRTPEEKQKFLRAVGSAMQDQGSNDFPDLPQ